MRPQYPKRLIEVDLPIKRISAHARREKSIRHGHISTLHIWWARRPLAACRAVILAALFPDPADPDCPPRFLEEARKALEGTRGTSVNVPSNMKVRWDYRKPKDVRAGLLDFIAEFANWDNSTNKDYLTFARHLVQVAHESLGGAPGTRPLVVDPFAGGGSIPLEALRVGADAFGTDLNPVAVLLNKVALEYTPRFGRDLAIEVRKWGTRIKHDAERELGAFYPRGPRGETTIAYIWSRTILSEAPGYTDIPIELPLLRSLWVSRGRGRNQALRWVRDEEGAVKMEVFEKTFADGVTRQVRRPLLEIIEPRTGGEVERGTSAGGSATCPVTGYTTPVEAVRDQLRKRRGGADDARLVCVVTSNVNEQGRFFRPPTLDDEKAALAAKQELRVREQDSVENLKLVPDGQINHLRGFFNIVLYGMTTWGDLFTSRQNLVLTTLASLVRNFGNQTSTSVENEMYLAVQTCLALAVDRQADRLSSLARWDSGWSKISNTFGRQALPMVWDFAEANPFSGATGDWDGAVSWVAKFIEANSVIQIAGTASMSSAISQSLPDSAVQAVITDPPYYAAVPYADLSDFFYSWLKRSLYGKHGELLSQDLTPKEDECVSLAHRAAMYRNKDGRWFERTMGLACKECCRTIAPNGIGVFVFASKETTAWEAMLAAIVDSGWVITACWPIDTEMGSRLRAQNSAVLASSIHIVARPRTNHEVGDWRSILTELPKRLHRWLPRLADEGIVGADAIFACLGPALEVFSCYASVEKASVRRSAFANTSCRFGLLLRRKPSLWSSAMPMPAGWRLMLASRRFGSGRSRLLPMAQSQVKRPWTQRTKTPWTTRTMRRPPNLRRAVSAWSSMPPARSPKGSALTSMT